MQWHSIVKIGQSLYREAPGVDPFRPDQVTPIPNFFLAGSYTKQVRARARGLRVGGAPALHPRALHEEGSDNVRGVQVQARGLSCLAPTVSLFDRIRPCLTAFDRA